MQDLSCSALPAMFDSAPWFVIINDVTIFHCYLIIWREGNQWKRVVAPAWSDITAEYDAMEKIFTRSVTPFTKRSSFEAMRISPTHLTFTLFGKRVDPNFIPLAVPCCIRDGSKTCEKSFLKEFGGKYGERWSKLEGSTNDFVLIRLDIRPTRQQLCSEHGPNVYLVEAPPGWEKEIWVTLKFFISHTCQ